MLPAPLLRPEQGSANAGSVNHHLLAQYYHSFCAIILQQFDNKLVHGGMEGIIQMCVETPVLGAILEEHMGLPLHEMQASLAALNRGQHLKIATARQPKVAFYIRESRRRLEVQEAGGSSSHHQRPEGTLPTRSCTTLVLGA